MANESETAKTITEACLKCGKSLDGLRRRSARKFCSDVCRTRHFALKRYHSIKLTPGYKVKRKEYEKQWRIDNRDQWLEKMRKASKKYREKKQLEKKNNQINEHAEEGLVGQQAGGTTFNPESEGADEGQAVDTDQSTHPEFVAEAVSNMTPENPTCICGHSSNQHSYDPESFGNNLDCDIQDCNCKDFRRSV